MSYAMRILLTCFLFTPYFLDAQKILLSGSIKDADSGNVLPFTTVAVLGQSEGTIANAEGYFSLSRDVIADTDTIQFSYVGYETMKVPVSGFQKDTQVLLKPATISLQALEVRDRQLTSEAILGEVRQRFSQNHPKHSMRQEVYYHSFEKTPWRNTNRIQVNESTFDGLDGELIERLQQELPDEFIQYQDAVINLYSHNGNTKIVPVEALSMQESSMKDLGEKMEDEFRFLVEDFEQAQENDDIYYKFKTGLLGSEIETNEQDDEFMKEQKKDSLYHLMDAENFRKGMMRLFDNYADIESENWEFMNKTGRYKYSEPKFNVIGDELVYQLDFTPKSKGLFKGTLYVSPYCFAVLQLDFEYADGVQTETFKMFGLEHALNYKRGKVFFERVGEAYYPKYIRAEKLDFVSISRDFSIQKKQRRFFIDKELNEIKMTIDLSFDISNNWELYVISRQLIDAVQYESIAEPQYVRYFKQYTYDGDFWAGRSVIAPTAELKSYERKVD